MGQRAGSNLLSFIFSFSLLFIPPPKGTETVPLILIEFLYPIHLVLTLWNSYFKITELTEKIPRVHFFYCACVCVCVCVLVTQLCLTLSNPIDCSSPGSSVFGILQARKLEWVAIPFSRGSSLPRDQTRALCSGSVGS